jgi:hypothetical protein
MPLSEITAIGLVPQRVAAAVAGSLCTVGLLLAAIGIYGVTSSRCTRNRRPDGARSRPSKRQFARLSTTQCSRLWFRSTDTAHL